VDQGESASSYETGFSTFGVSRSLPFENGIYGSLDLAGQPVAHIGVFPGPSDCFAIGLEKLENRDAEGLGQPVEEVGRGKPFAGLDIPDHGRRAAAALRQDLLAYAGRAPESLEILREQRTRAGPACHSIPLGKEVSTCVRPDSINY